MACYNSSYCLPVGRLKQRKSTTRQTRLSVSSTGRVFPRAQYAHPRSAPYTHPCIAQEHPTTVGDPQRAYRADLSLYAQAIIWQEEPQ